MKRLIGTVLTCALLGTPVFAGESKEKEAVKQCKSEYSEAKKMAGEKKTRKERSEAKKDAKKHYNECVEKVKH